MAKLDREIITDTTIGTTAELAALMGVSTRRVQQLTAEGILNTAAKGHYLLAASVQSYLAYRLGEAMTPEELKIERRRREAETTLKEAKAKMAHLEAGAAEGHYHRGEDVQGYIESLVYEIRTAFLSLPGRLAVEVAHSSDPSECGEIIKREIKQCLQALSEWEYDPEYYSDKEAERKQWRATIEQDIEAADAIG